MFVKLQYDSSVIKLPNNNDKYGGKTMDGSNHYQVIPLFSSDLTGTKGCISIGILYHFKQILNAAFYGN